MTLEERDFYFGKCVDYMLEYNQRFLASSCSGGESDATNTCQGVFHDMGITVTFAREELTTVAVPM